MTDAPDPEEIARRYMEFWQQHMAGLTRDPQVAEAIAGLFDMMTQGATALARMMTQPGTAGSAAGGGKSAADQNRRLDQLARRVAELEQRVARLEPRAAKRRQPASGKPRRRPRR
ncbi:MAG: hypothetical protein FJX42_07435 [Alphaproteobacteria bacterium]|nr:hypothetical protein [Alphaproteobacteria bacterium]